MKSRSTILVVSVVILTVILIATVGLYILAVINQPNGNAGPALAVAGIIVALALAAVALALVARALRKKKLVLLKPEFQDVLELVMIQVASSNLGYLARRQLDDELVDLFAQASSDGRVPQQVIGDDVNEFADRIIAAYGSKRSFWLLELSGIQYFAGYLLFVQGYEYLRDNEGYATYFQARMELTTIILYAVIAFLTIPLTLWLYQAGQRADRPILGSVAFVAVPPVTVGLFIGFMEVVLKPLADLETPWAVWLYDADVQLIPNSLVLILIILAIPLVWLIKRAIRRHRIQSAD